MLPWNTCLWLAEIVQGPILITDSVLTLKADKRSLCPQTNINNVTLAYDDNRQRKASKEIIYCLHIYFTNSSQKLQVCKAL